MTDARVYHLVEYDEKSGLGHLRRQLVLAEAFHDAGATCRFGLTSEVAPPNVLNVEIEKFLWNGKDLPNGAEADIVIIDGKCFELDLSGWQVDGPLIVVMDDVGDQSIEADVVVNQNLYGASCNYRHHAVEKVLAGPQYTLLGAPFRRLAVSGVSGNGILISFGSADTGTYALPMATALRRRLTDVLLRVALMRASPTTEEKLRSMGCEVYVGRPLEEAISGTCLYLGAAGFTLIETAFAGLTPVVCAIAPDQILNIRHLKKLGIDAFERYAPDSMAAVAVRYHGMSDRPKIQHSDGCGAERLTKGILLAYESKCAQR